MPLLRRTPVCAAGVTCRTSPSVAGGPRRLIPAVPSPSLRKITMYAAGVTSETSELQPLRGMGALTADNSTSFSIHPERPPCMQLGSPVGPVSFSPSVASPPPPPPQRLRPAFPSPSFRKTTMYAAGVTCRTSELQPLCGMGPPTADASSGARPLLVLLHQSGQLRHFQCDGAWLLLLKLPCADGSTSLQAAAVCLVCQQVTCNSQGTAWRRLLKYEQGASAAADCASALVRGRALELAFLCCLLSRHDAQG